MRLYDKFSGTPCVRAAPHDKLQLGEHKPHDRSRFKAALAFRLIRARRAKRGVKPRLNVYSLLECLVNLPTP